MGRVRKIRENKSHSIMEISVWRENRPVSGAEKVFFLNATPTFSGADSMILS